MKIFFSISMSVLFLFQGISIDMDFCGPIKDISKVITHYQDHKVYGDSFFEYVVEDYIDNNAQNKEHHHSPDKENTPIHSHNQCCHPLVLIIANNTLALTNQLNFEEKKQYNLHKVNFTSRYLESLFQPPRA
ncbi:hypothetical protein JM80_2481 [Cellulophaga sp. RHA_52]|uniref:hypothetical protein n=1 Tax=Cellulophaga TaxID=104264 RepID=UPI000B2BB4CB|nr:MULTISPECIES: hypothetical protein [Cellulophaga]TVZ09948.1 hypothetical protein JM80_2481 [Cellulophaga sp. RHA_52]WKB81070.1 hypothetical protein QYR09_15105 [Cellulophaga lytica]